MNTFTKNTLDALVNDLGTAISRKDLGKWFAEKAPGMRVPYQLSQFPTDQRGVYDMTPHIASFAQYGGFNAKAYVGSQSANAKNEEPFVNPKDEMSDEELLQHIKDNFKALDRMAVGVVQGDFRGVIVSGNPGIGKTFGIEKILENARDNGRLTYTAVKGFVRPTGLFRLLWEHRNQGVIAFDDADSIFNDETSLNLLKAALDTTKKRTISWRSEKPFMDEMGEQIPNTFDFDGQIVFITNLDFDRKINSNSNLAPHFEALVSRAFYMDLNLRSHRELMLRIKDVVENSDMLRNLGLSNGQIDDVMEFFLENFKQLREVSLRTVLKLGRIRHSATSLTDFNVLAKATILRSL